MNLGHLSSAIFLVILGHCAMAQGWRLDPKVTGLQEMMAKSAVRIETMTHMGRRNGSGLLFRVQLPGNLMRHIPVVITARHLATDIQTLSLSFSVKRDERLAGKESVKFEYTKGSLTVERHPDPTVDLCAILIGVEIYEFRKKGIELGYYGFDDSILADEAFYQNERQLDPVVMVGFQDDFLDSANLQPIFRRGVYAMNPSLDYRGRKEFLLDIPNNGGSSGSPVFRFDEKMFSDRSAGCANITIGSRLTLVGISFDGVDPSSGTNVPRVLSGPLTSTAQIIKAVRIKELSDMLRSKCLVRQ